MIIWQTQGETTAFNNTLARCRWITNSTCNMKEESVCSVRLTFQAVGSKTWYDRPNQKVLKIEKWWACRAKILCKSLVKTNNTSCRMLSSAKLRSSVLKTKAVLAPNTEIKTKIVLQVGKERAQVMVQELAVQLLRAVWTHLLRKESTTNTQMVASVSCKVLQIPTTSKNTFLKVK